MIELAEVTDRPVSRETRDRLARYLCLLRDESARQNLVAASTLESAWERHVLDSAQLVRFAPHPNASWADVGSGAGLPGLIVASLTEGPVALIEPRRLRAEFLAETARKLGLDRVTVHHARAESVTGRFDVITARAVAPLAKLLKISAHLSTGNTRWVLPKGRNARAELAEAQRTWQGVFHVEPSVTDGDSSIIVATGVEPK